MNRRAAKEGQQQADFISCQAWAKTAEFISKYFSKGQQVAIVGRIQTRFWEDNERKRHYITEVIVEEPYFADSKKNSEGRTAPARQTYSDSGASSGDGFYPMDEDDELPFNRGLDFPKQKVA